MKATASISVCAMIIGVARRQRRKNVPKIMPMIALPMKPPNPWYRWCEPRIVALIAMAYSGGTPSLRSRARGEPGQQVAGDQDLFKQAVLQRGQQQDGIAPPDVRLVLRHHVQRDARLVGDEVQAEAASPDERGQDRAEQ